ncbi:hypothetical protein WJX72_006899 [[Myrmecia] bisecta]|uniref:Methyltransferase domain-containing protein n=1 Tax=[Myrmecia] bisecta TaxID=41462 RepID=A0AAW1PHP5_9CHLO
MGDTVDDESLELKGGAEIKDSGSAYGSPSTTALLAAAQLRAAQLVVEFGCGSGRLAERLLQQELPPTARYIGFDQSTSMARLSQQRLEPFGQRAQVILTDGDPASASMHVDPGSCDAFISTYALDLLSEEDVATVLELAWRLLKPGGRLCLVGLTYGNTSPTRISTGVWELIHRLRPTAVGGCRPQDMSQYLGPGWKVVHRQVVTGGLLCSEVLVAEKVSCGP